ncbi:MAG: polysaccharide biosynthesis tyrosine autokinase [Clostridia bacterium]|nr:polysaccharide biosynthesis tyrosine autokinase [Clostridia bacterium]
MRELRFDYVNFYTIIRDIIRNLWIIFLAAVTGFLGVRAYFDFTYKAEFKCTTTISIAATDSGLYSFSSLNKTIEAASAFQEMFQSTYFREKLSDITGNTVDGIITAEQISETNLISMSYTSSNPIDAYVTLNAIIDNYNEITDYNFNNMIINIIAPPVVPSYPSNPISYGQFDKIIPLGMITVVLFFIIATSYFRDTVKNESDVNSMLDAKLFSVIYHENKNKTIKSRLKLTHSKEPLMITNILINYRFSETFRIAALKLDYYIKSKNIKTLMITSCGENEGKSTAAVNLALAMSKLGRKTLLVDADLRKPAIFKFFSDAVDPEESLGLGEVLRGNTSINNAIFKEHKTGLYIMCSKHKYSNSSEMLSTKRFEHFVDAIKEQFDIVIFDTSPTSLVSDAEIISPNIDAALIVVRQDVAPVPEINDMIDMLNQSGTSVEGCIFNDVHILPKIFADSSVTENNSGSEVNN